MKISFLLFPLAHSFFRYVSHLVCDSTLSFFRASRSFLSFFWSSFLHGVRPLLCWWRPQWFSDSDFCCISRSSPLPIPFFHNFQKQFTEKLESLLSGRKTKSHRECASYGSPPDRYSLRILLACTLLLPETLSNTHTPKDITRTQIKVFWEKHM